VTKVIYNYTTVGSQLSVHVGTKGCLDKRNDVQIAEHPRKLYYRLLMRVCSQNIILLAHATIVWCLDNRFVRTTGFQTIDSLTVHKTSLWIWRYCTKHDI